MNIIFVMDNNLRMIHGMVSDTILEVYIKEWITSVFIKYFNLC